MDRVSKRNCSLDDELASGRDHRRHSLPKSRPSTGALIAFELLILDGGGLAVRSILAGTVRQSPS